MKMLFLGHILSLLTALKLEKAMLFLILHTRYICIAQVRIAMLKEKHCYNSSTPNLPSLRLDLFRDPQTFYRF